MGKNSIVKSLYESTPLSGEEASALALEARKGNKAAQDKLVLGCMFWVRSAVKKTGAMENIEDLHMAGVAGIIKAIERFDPKKGMFTSFAYSYILDAVYEAIRKENHLVVLPNNVWRDKRRVANFCDDYRKNYGSMPSDEKTMKTLGMTRKALSLTRMGGKASCVDQKDYNDTDCKTDIVPFEWLSNDVCYADSYVLSEELSCLLSRLINEALNGKEREALLRHFGIGYEESMKFKEIGEIIGMNYQATRRLVEKAKWMLKEELAKYGYSSIEDFEFFQYAA